MAHLSENYYLRNCFFKNNEVPTQTVMKQKMSLPLANVYFKSLSPKLKVLAGFEPAMKGGGTDWFVPPKDLLQGTAIVRPLKGKYLKQLNCLGVDDIGMKIVENYRKQMKLERRVLLHGSDHAWHDTLNDLLHQEWKQRSAAAAQENTLYMQKTFNEFTSLYRSSVNKCQDLLFDAAMKLINTTREETFNKMQAKYEDLLKKQAIMLYDIYAEKLRKEKERLKAAFIKNVGIARTEMGDKIHDINVEKHLAIEKLRKLLQCQNLACQVYIALKERQECLKEIETMKHDHIKKTKMLAKELATKDIELELAKCKEKRMQEFDSVWMEKVSHVVTKFQIFVSYCLNMLPEHAEFFINMEKLMLIQLSEALGTPSAGSIFVKDEYEFHTPIPRPHPFYLFCDKSNKVEACRAVEQDLCPKHCTSSASQLPVIIINKRFIYAACDNFEQYTDKIKDYVDGKLGDIAAEFEDYHDYSYNLNVKYTSSQQLKELKLESSLLQVLQQEIANIKELSIECGGCKIPHCFCCSQDSSSSHTSLRTKLSKMKSQASLPKPSSDVIKLTREDILELQREPKWESYMSYVRPKKCECAKTAKKHLMENLPPYMRKMSKYEAPELPKYKTCSIAELKMLVKKASGRQDVPPPPPKVPSITKEITTQVSDHEFDYLCTCFSDNEVNDFFKTLYNNAKAASSDDNQEFQVVGSKLSASYLTQQKVCFAADRVLSLRRLIDQSPDVKEIFKSCAPREQ